MNEKDKKKLDINILLREMYKFEPEDLVPDISIVRYSNLAYVQITPRDVTIDFLEMPGVKKEDKVLINGTRIYLSFTAAKRLSEALGKTLEEVHKQGAMEKYQ